MKKCRCAYCFTVTRVSEKMVKPCLRKRFVTASMTRRSSFVTAPHAALRNLKAALGATAGVGVWEGGAALNSHQYHPTQHPPSATAPRASGDILPPAHTAPGPLARRHATPAVNQHPFQRPPPHSSTRPVSSTHTPHIRSHPNPSGCDLPTPPTVVVGVVGGPRPPPSLPSGACGRAREVTAWSSSIPSNFI